MRWALVLVAAPAASVLIEHVSVDSAGTIHMEDDTAVGPDKVPGDVPDKNPQDDKEKVPVLPSEIASLGGDFAQYVEEMKKDQNIISKHKAVTEKLEKYTDILPTCKCSNFEQMLNQNIPNPRHKLCSQGGEGLACKYMPKDWDSKGNLGCGQQYWLKYDKPCVYMNTFSDAVTGASVDATAAEVAMQHSCRPQGKIYEKFQAAKARIEELERDMDAADANFDSWSHQNGKVYKDEVLNHEKFDCKPDFELPSRPATVSLDFDTCLRSLADLLDTKWHGKRELQIQQGIIDGLDQLQINKDRKLKLSNIINKWGGLEKCWSTLPGQFRGDATPDDEILCENRNAQPIFCQRPTGGDSPQEKVNWRCNSDMTPCTGSNNSPPPAPPSPPLPPCITAIQVGYSNFQKFEQDAAAYKAAVQAKALKNMNIWMASVKLGGSSLAECFDDDPCSDSENESDECKPKPVPAPKYPRCDCRSQNLNSKPCTGRGHVEALFEYVDTCDKNTDKQLWPKDGDLGCMQKGKNNDHNIQCEKPKPGQNDVNKPNEVCRPDYIICEYQSTTEGKMFRKCNDQNSCGSRYDKDNDKVKRTNKVDSLDELN